LLQDEPNAGSKVANGGRRETAGAVRDEAIAADRTGMLALFLFAAQLVSFDERLRLGQYYLEHKQVGRAATEFEAAAALQPDSAAAYYNLGVALRLWGDAQGAEKALREAFRLQPRFPEAHFVLGLTLGDRVGSESAGLAEFEAAIAQNP